MRRMHAIWCMLAFGLALSCAAASRATAAEPAAFDRRESAQLDRAVRDLCRKDVVLLGEDANHGGGRTMQVKVELLRRLVSRCGFDAVLFEAPIYETLALEREFAAGTATPESVTDAAGMLWFWADEARPLADFLHRETAAGRLRIGGIDVQPIVVNARFSQQRLGDELASTLDAAARRDACAEEIARHNRWDYDDALPFDPDAQARLRDCIDAIRATIAENPARASAQTAAMAAAYARYLGMAMDGDGDQRGLGMFENLLWYRQRWPRGTRIVVWCATVHAAKRLDGVAPRMRPLGAWVHERFGERAAAIGFTAAAGEFGNIGGRGEALRMPPAAPEALETKALGDDRIGLRYLDRKRLARYGTIAARPINYRIVHAAPWAEALDGLIVLREERLTTPIAR